MKELYPVVLRHILIFVVLCSAFLLWFHQSNQEYPAAQGGILDLSHWDFNSEGRITLSGEWEFNWRKFLTWEDFKNDSNLESFYVSVPQIWNNYQLNGESLPGFGYATYHLKVKIPDKSTPLSIRISSMSTAYQCYINNIPIAQNGKISTSPKGAEPCYKPITATFTPGGNEFDIIVHVSNYTYARGGLWFDIDFGTAEQIDQYNSFLKIKDGFIIGSLTIMALYFFCYYCMLNHDPKFFNFMLMCLILIIRTTLYGDYLMIQVFPSISFRMVIWITFLTLLWFPVVLYQMIQNYINNPKYTSLSRVFYTYAFLMSAVIGLLPVSLYTHWTPVIDLMAILIFGTALSNVFFAHIKKLPGTNVILLGSLVVAFTGLHDMLYQSNLINSRIGELAPIGLIIFMLMLFLLMAEGFAKTYREVQSLSDERSDKLKLEQDLTERLYALDKLKDEFLTNTSHELRAPLNVIINIVQSVLQGIGGQINQVQRQNLEIVLNSAKKLHIMINDLLDVSLLQSGGIHLHSTPLAIQTLISNMLVVFQHLKKNDAITLVNEIPPDFPLVLADEIRLRQILNTLLGNALKYTESGSITIGASHDGEWARIYIEDTGIGIEPAHLPNIFDAFEQVDGTIQRKCEGAGLGLYISKQLVDLHGGKIWITSDLGMGTQVYFTLPLLSDKTAEFPNQLLYGAVESNTLDFLELEFEQNENPYDILAVDDDDSSLKALMNTMQLANYHVKGARNGNDALRLLENGASFELVILDAMMPQLSGFEILEILRKKYTRLELPVLMLTSKSQSEDMSLCFKLGANDYLSKPFKVDELLARVSSLIKLKKAVDKLITTEMSFLQAQIKPHFIHNALSVISSLSIKDPHKAKTLILDLSDYLRGSFDLTNDEGLTTLSKELETVRAYLSIEQARFKERLHVYYHLIDDVDCTLPLLTIQPLVENAIRHGIMCRMEGGEIHIATSLEPNRVRIEISDNGVGMESTRIAKFFELKQDQRDVGVVNIHRRLMTQYGEGLHIESAPNQGTIIYFYVPYVSGQEILE